MPNPITDTPIIHTDYATLWYHPDTKIVHHVFHKFIYGDEFLSVLNTGLDAFKQYGAQKWLSDDRKNSALPTADLEWSINDWFHRAFNSGWKYWAIVMPDKVVGKMNMQRFIKTYVELGLTIEIFDDPDEAMTWLVCC